ncbi:metallophosphoesterase [Frankia sp. CNm7]|uniref:Metallophosphoesterase n=1 Tax=Frankia nepalensis TaxID=1836974 RepID=A0A937RNE0_9ACTN|nr:metallophosphoesterase [Frankia nepalensis]MBL7495813.1 metallophosphoesterase [Frankia nepalensis]MBL7509889.1 metallophosphoesterase [Frankia nepalensis]MBL7517644.1 metallophosphoesterase [Frankia nepalensis]MBL7629648.1 metallophosphoesterase [Frankia nepalensis]
MVRIAAVGDLHVTAGAAARLRPVYERVVDVADVLLLAGDLTEDGGTSSAEEVCELFGGLDLPVVAVLGNHDYDRGHEAAFSEMLTDAGVTVLEGTSTVVDTAAGQVGIAGVKGFGGGFAGCTAAVHGEREMKAFAEHAVTTAQVLRDALSQLDSDLRVALLHYAPTRETLVGEPLELYPFLGSYLLGAAIDGEQAFGAAPRPAGAQGTRTPGERPGGDPTRELAPGGRRRVALALHGHAHYGTEVGETPAGTAVRNVAAPVIKAPFAVYQLPEAVRVG